VFGWWSPQCQQKLLLLLLGYGSWVLNKVVLGYWLIEELKEHDQ